MAQSLKVDIDAGGMLLYLDVSVAFEEVMFRRRSWSLIGLPTYTRSELVLKVKYSVLLALDIHGYLPSATLLVGGSIDQAM